MGKKITIRLNKEDDANMLTILNTLRSDARPFVSRSQVLKAALRMAAADVDLFIDSDPGSEPVAG